jgi:type II secretory pathway component PulK
MYMQYEKAGRQARSAKWYAKVAERLARNRLETKRRKGIRRAVGEMLDEDG